MQTATPTPDDLAALAALDALAASAPAANEQPADTPSAGEVDPDPSTVNFDRRDALADRLRTDAGPAHLHSRLELLRELAAHGAPFLAAEAYLRHEINLTETERSALVAAVYHAQPGEQGDAHLPEIDVADLFGDAPAVVEQINIVAETTQSSRDLMALGALAAASTALARKVQIQLPGDGWFTYPNLHVVAEAGSGRGKGPMTKRMGCLGVISRWQAELVGRRESECRKRKLEREILEDQRRDTYKAARKAKDREALLTEVARIDTLLAASQLPELPWFVVNDVTPQRFVDMCHTSGFVMLCHGEGQVLLKGFTGKNDSTDGLGAWLASWSVEEQQRDRVGTAGKIRPRDGLVASTCLLPLQKGILAPTTPDAQAMLRDLADRGAFARWIVARPRRIDIDEATDEVVALDRGVREAQSQYDELLLSLCESAIDLDPQRPLAPAKPVVVAVADDVAAAFLRFQRRYKAQANERGPMSDPFREPIAMKLGEQALRIAAVVAALRVRRFGKDGFTLTMDDWQRAARFVENYVLPHALACCDRVSGSPIEADAAEMLAYLTKHGSMTMRALRGASPFKNGWGLAGANDRRERFDAALDSLVRRSKVVLEPLPRKSVMIRVIRGAA